MKDFMISIGLIAAVVWLFKASEGLPETIHLEGTGLIAIPLFLLGMYLCFSGKKVLPGIGIMFVTLVVFGGVLQ
jgi:hypothetical protein